MSPFEHPRGYICWLAGCLFCLVFLLVCPHSHVSVLVYNVCVFKYIPLAS